MNIFELEMQPGQQMPKQIDVIKMPTPPPAPTGPDGTSENGIRTKTTQKGNRSVSSGAGTYIFTPKGQLMLYMTPKLAGLQQTHNIAKQTVIVNYGTTIDNVGVDQKATYDMSGKLISGDNTSVSSGPVSMSMDKDKGTSMSYGIRPGSKISANSKTGMDLSKMRKAPDQLAGVNEKFMSFDTDTTTNRSTTTNKFGTFTNSSTTDNKVNPKKGSLDDFGPGGSINKTSSDKVKSLTTGDDTRSSMLQAGPPYPKDDVPQVIQLQKSLQALGYDIGSTGIDGKYGPRTTRAVRAFKADYNVPGNGLEFGKTATSTIASVTKGTTPKVKPKKSDKSYAGGGELGTMPDYSGRPGETSGKIGDLLDMISKPESGGRYDMVYPGRRRPQILDMTIAELIVDMKSRGKAKGSSASGRYQYIRKTLLGVTRSMGMDINTTKFDPKTQDEIVIYHLRKDHGLESWLSGRTSDEKFLARLAKTWAGLPDPKTGKSYYAGDGMNKSGVGAQASLNTLQSIRTA